MQKYVSTLHEDEGGDGAKFGRETDDDCHDDEMAELETVSNRTTTGPILSQATTIRICSDLLGLGEEA